MREIAKAFNISVEHVEKEIAQLIISKQIQSKIDSHSKVRPFLPYIIFSSYIRERTTRL